MKQLNTLPIEDFLNKAKITIKTNQPSMSLTLREVIELQSSISSVMIRLVNDMESKSNQEETIQIRMDGGKF